VLERKVSQQLTELASKLQVVRSNFIRLQKTLEQIEEKTPIPFLENLDSFLAAKFVTSLTTIYDALSEEL
jgi:hypothetical protein